MLQPLKRLLDRKNRGIGVEITPERINIAQLRSSERGYQLTTFSSLEVPEEIFQEGQIADVTALAELLKQALSAKKLKVTKVATAVPTRDSISRIISVPAELDDQELREVVINQEANLCLPYPREEVDLDYLKLGYFEDEDGIEKVQVLLVATKREVTDTYLEVFQQAGLETDVLEINSFALLRTVREQLRQFGSLEAAVLVDIEFDNTEIVILVEGVPQFNRTVPIGTYQLQSALSRAMNLPTSRNTEFLQEFSIPEPGNNLPKGMAVLQKMLGELSDEIRRSIDFYLSQSEGIEIAQLLLAGPGGGIEKLDDFFTQRLDFAAASVDPVAALSLQTEEEIPKAKRSGLGTVIGLGLREINS